MTVGKRALMKASEGDPVHAPEEPSVAAFGLLSRAQALADRLRTEVEAEVAALRVEANAARDEARRVLIDASTVRDDALSASRSAQARLQEAQYESAQIVADAADQAILVVTTASQTSESLLADTQVEADEVRNAAQVDDLRLRGLAAIEFEQVREHTEALESEAAARIESHETKVSAELQRLREDAAQHARSVLAAAEKTAKEAISRADTDAGATRASTMQELDRARA